MDQLNNDFCTIASEPIAPGVSYCDIEFWRHGVIQARGRAAFIDIQQVELRIDYFPDLIEHNFFGVGESRSQQLPNFGMSLPDFFDPLKRLDRRATQQDLSKILVACNTVHTNFVRGNGFVIVDGQLIHKPESAIAIDGQAYIPLDGQYDCLILLPYPPKIRSVWIEHNMLRTVGPIQLAISGPRLISKGTNIVHHIPVCTRDRGQTVGNEVNYSPYSDRTSFTCFGITGQGELVIISMFAGNAQQRSDYRCFETTADMGITLNEMAELLIRLGAIEAIAGGGSGDTQQYIKGHGLWVSMPRLQPQRGQVAGVRGLGAILLILSK